MITEIERSITVRNESVHLIMPDMSKVFDCINIKKMIEDLQKCYRSRRATYRLQPIKYMTLFQI